MQRGPGWALWATPARTDPENPGGPDRPPVADQIAYVNHDIDDAIRAGILTAEDIPRRHLPPFWARPSADRINTLVCDMIFTSREAGAHLHARPRFKQALADLRGLHVCAGLSQPRGQGRGEPRPGICCKCCFGYYVDACRSSSRLISSRSCHFDGLGRAVCDYIAGMTDKYAIDKYSTRFLCPPAGMSGDNML